MTAVCGFNPWAASTVLFVMGVAMFIVGCAFANSVDTNRKPHTPATIKRGRIAAWIGVFFMLPLLFRLLTMAVTPS